MPWPVYLETSHRHMVYSCLDSRVGIEHIVHEQQIDEFSTTTEIGYIPLSLS